MIGVITHWMTKTGSEDEDREETPTCGNCTNNDDGYCRFWEKHLTSENSNCRTGYTKQEDE